MNKLKEAFKRNFLDLELKYKLGWISYFIFHVALFYSMLNRFEENLISYIILSVSILLFAIVAIMDEKDRKGNK